MPESNAAISERIRETALLEQRQGVESMWFISQVVSGKPETARACYVWARGYTLAIFTSKALGLHIEGSESLAMDIDYIPPTDKIGILLTRDEVRAIEAGPVQKNIRLSPDPEAIPIEPPKIILKKPFGSEEL